MSSPPSPNSTSEMESYWCVAEPDLQRAWSPSSLGTLQDCPRKYLLLTYRGGWRSPTGPAILFGSHLHTALEVYDRALCAGADWDDATRSALTVALQLGKELEAFEGDNTRTRLTPLPRGGLVRPGVSRTML